MESEYIYTVYRVWEEVRRNNDRELNTMKEIVVLQQNAELKMSKKVRRE